MPARKDIFIIADNGSDLIANARANARSRGYATLTQLISLFFSLP